MEEAYALSSRKGHRLDQTVVVLRPYDAPCQLIISYYSLIYQLMEYDKPIVYVPAQGK